MALLTKVYQNAVPIPMFKKSKEISPDKEFQLAYANAKDKPDYQLTKCK